MKPEYYCLQPLERYVWDGDQLLYELRAFGADTLHGSGLQSDVSYGNFFGQIRYTHALG